MNGIDFLTGKSITKEVKKRERKGSEDDKNKHFFVLKKPVSKTTLANTLSKTLFIKNLDSNKVAQTLSGFETLIALNIHFDRTSPDPAIFDLTRGLPLYTTSPLPAIPTSRLSFT